MTPKKTEYLLKAHPLYLEYVTNLKKRLQKLKGTLSETDFREHEDVKFAARLRRATYEIILEDPDRPDYRLKGLLSKFRRYKQGLQRYRLFFCFSQKPPIIVYLYVNDRNSLRKQGSKRDPYEIFSKFVARGKITSNPNDLRLPSWLSSGQGS